MTLYNNNTTQPPITLPHMATLLSCVRVVPGSDPGRENKQRNDETKSVTRAPPIPSTSYPSQSLIVLHSVVTPQFNTF